MLMFKLIIACLSFTVSIGYNIPRFPRWGDFAGRSRVPSNLGYSYKTLYIDQQVDHFGFINNDTYKQRYLLSDQYWDRNAGPIFFYTGNEGDITLFCNNTGFMWEIAPQFKAMVVFAEHRYYGESLPYGPDAVKDPKKLSYLTSEQALADFAMLISYLKSTTAGAEDSKVIVFGGSYGGMLSAWFRMKYPNIVDGALAASAPIWNFVGQVPCERFNEVITNSFKKASPLCVENIRNMWNTIDHLASTDDGREYLTREMKLCKPITSPSDAALLKDWMTEAMGFLAMADYPYPASFIEPLPAWPIKVVCKPLSVTLLEGKVLIHALSEAMSVYYNYKGQAKCLDVSQTTTSSLGNFLWNYQACTEMVMSFCANGKTDMFEPAPANFTLFSDDCYRKFQVRPRKDWAIIQYLGKNIQSISNIIFRSAKVYVDDMGSKATVIINHLKSNGLLDPWSSGGVLTTLTDHLPAIIIPNGAHHVDLRESNPSDTSDITAARNREKRIIQSWLSTYNSVVDSRKSQTYMLPKNKLHRYTGRHHNGKNLYFQRQRNGKKHRKKSFYTLNWLKKKHHGERIIVL